MILYATSCYSRIRTKIGFFITVLSSQGFMGLGFSTCSQPAPTPDCHFFVDVHSQSCRDLAIGSDQPQEALKHWHHLVTIIQNSRVAFGNSAQRPSLTLAFERYWILQVIERDLCMSDISIGMDLRRILKSFLLQTAGNYAGYLLRNQLGYSQDVWIRRNDNQV